MLIRYARVPLTVSMNEDQTLTTGYADGYGQSEGVLFPYRPLTLFSAWRTIHHSLVIANTIQYTTRTGSPFPWLKISFLCHPIKHDYTDFSLFCQTCLPDRRSRDENSPQCAPYTKLCAKYESSPSYSHTSIQNLH